MSADRFFTTGAALQEYLLAHAGPGDLTIIPHQRLAHQLWHRQRTAALAAGRPAWEPLSLFTLNAWWSELFIGLWSDQALAPPLVRLALWGQALQAAPPPAGPTPELAWAQALDETHILLARHLLAPDLTGTEERPPEGETPLLAWRRRVSRVYTDLLRRGAWLSPGEVPGLLLAALRDGRLRLSSRVLVVGMETPAPLEDLWLREISRHTQVVHLQVRGDEIAVRRAVALPDPAQEVDWVAAQLLAAAQGGDLAGHRLAVTAMNIDSYVPHLRRVLAELLGPVPAADGYAYNFSQGPHLGEVPLFAAALLPLRFISARERREDLVSLLLSPYYGWLQAHGRRLAPWDRIFRERRLDRSWDKLREAVRRSRPSPGETEVLERLDRLWGSRPHGAATPGQWHTWVKAAWDQLGFPRGLDPAERESWERLTGLLVDLDTALGQKTLDAADYLEWLNLAAQRVILPGPGLQTAGIQVLGLLEMRGLDFSRVFCLGLNSGTLPAPPRPLPLLAAAEKHRVLGGTYQSQHHFAAALFKNLLGVAPHLTLTRPRLVDQEERVSTPLYLGAWGDEEMPVLSRPHPAWLRSAAVKAAFDAPPQPARPAPPDRLLPVPLPAEISLSQVSAALKCPCRFWLEVLLKLKELPDIEAGLDPRERGQMLHTVLARFGAAFQKLLDAAGDWDPHGARELLQETVGQVLAPCGTDLHWQAEVDRWLGEAGLLWEWLSRERERFEQGWRWLGFEVGFRELQDDEWPFALRGRVDRLDYHPESGELVIWDYKSGEVPGKAKVLQDLEEPQLPGYLLAARQGRLPAPPEPADLRAGFIGLKSPRPQHLKHEDFKATPGEWQAAALDLAERLAALGSRLAAGDFRPDPTPAPEGNNPGACRYCPFDLVCGFAPDDLDEEDS